MASYKENLAALLVNAPDDLSEDALRELATAAQTLTRYGLTPPATTPATVTQIDPAAAARTKLAELAALPPPVGDRAKVERAEAQASALRILHPHLAGPNNPEAFDVFFPRGGDAA